MIFLHHEVFLRGWVYISLDYPVKILLDKQISSICLPIFRKYEVLELLSRIVAVLDKKKHFGNSLAF